MSRKKEGGFLRLPDRPGQAPKRKGERHPLFSPARPALVEFVKGSVVIASPGSSHAGVWPVCSISPPCPQPEGFSAREGNVAGRDSCPPWSSRRSTDIFLKNHSRKIDLRDEVGWGTSHPCDGTRPQKFQSDFLMASRKRHAPGRPENT